jgi:ABC-type transport system involved in multi-copper enzyme maturation permease subunit
MLRPELKRAFISSGFVAGFLIATLSLLLGAYPYWRDFLIFGNSGLGDPLFFNSYDAVIDARFGLLSVLVPIIAALPFAASYAIDVNSGYIRPSILRAKRFNYLAIKFVVNFVVGGVVVSLPQILLYALASLLFPEGLTTPEVYHQQRVIVAGLWETVYWSDPALYIWLVILLSFVFGGVYASIGMAAGSISQNTYVALVAPFILYLPGTFILNTVGIRTWLPTVTFTPQQIPDASVVSVFGSLLSLLIIACLTFGIASVNKFRDL